MSDKSLPQKQSDNEQKSHKAEIIELEQELLSVNPRIFDGIKKEKKEELLRSFSVTLIQEKSHSGPLPDAETLIQYDSVIPNGADRIMAMAEKQQDHRINIETKSLDSSMIHFSFNFLKKHSISTLFFFFIRKVLKKYSN
jgi:uncharacterized membrane protein